VKTTEAVVTPYDEILNRVRTYVSDPKLVTKGTLRDLLGELEDLKPLIDEDDDEEEKPDGRPSLISMLENKGGR